MATSQNGWTVLDDRPPKATVPYIDYEVGFYVRPGDVAVILMEVARRFHNEVQRLDLPGPKDEWGWAERPIRGQATGYSNHASGTAIDLNAVRLARGAPTDEVLSQTQIARCRAIVQSFKDKESGELVVRWGGDYRVTPDAMHWEIVGDADQVSRVADRVRLKWREIEEEMAAPTAEENAAETVRLLLTTPIVQMPYVKALLGDVDGKMTLAEALNHAVGQAAGTLRADAELAQAVARLTQKVDELTTLVLSQGGTE